MLNMIYLIMTATSMGFGLLCMTTATLTLYLGPGKALRAQSIAEIEETIEHMKNKSHTCFWFFVCELISFHVSSCMLMWILYSETVAMVVNLVLIAALLQFVFEGLYIIKRLHVEEDEAVKSRIDMLRPDADLHRLDGISSGQHSAYVAQ